MNSKLLSIALVTLVVIGAGIAYVLLQKSAQPRSGEDAAKNTKVQDSPQANSPNIAKGAYVDYTEAGFASAQGTRLIFFHAPWCPQCRALDESIRTNTLPNDVTIFKVDYDSNQSLRIKYGVTLQTTVVKTDEKGNKVASHVAYDEPTFQSLKQALLP